MRLITRSTVLATSTVTRARQDISKRFPSKPQIEVQGRKACQGPLSYWFGSERELMFHAHSECQAQLRDAWPLLWQALDDLVRLVEGDDPREVPSLTLFDHLT